MFRNWFEVLKVWSYFTALIPMDTMQCPRCHIEVTDSGECECSEEFTVENQEQSETNFYKTQFLQLIRACIRLGIPNPSQNEQPSPASYDTINNAARRAFMNDPQRMIHHMNYYKNGVSIDVNNGWFLRHSAASDQIPHSSTENNSLSIVEDANDSVFESDENMDLYSAEPNYCIQVRVRWWGVDTYMWGAVVEIVGEGLYWQQILHNVETNAAHITWHFYVWEIIEFVSEGASNDAQDHERLHFDEIVNMFSQNGNATDSVKGPPPAARTAVEGLKTQVIMVEGTSRDAFCCICQDVMVVGESTTHMPCEHAFHEKCIEKWLTSTNSCPLCKYELPTDDSDYEERKHRRCP
ncbi:hypothetical protein KI387_035647 [Taxus chinensis]|uniref:RING-type E3 ubiquitin transferase n=1 Tax=Taxus chinensis TaxID=29808 RepID=A0AA38FPF9_TAXCH|nr:hypothetical protein KI387_035647 [Taxus chinensis]